MKALLFITFVLVSNPSIVLTKVLPQKDMIVCSMQEGMLNQPYTGYMERGQPPEITEILGHEYIFGRASCRDLNEHPL